MFGFFPKSRSQPEIRGPLVSLTGHWMSGRSWNYGSGLKILIGDRKKPKTLSIISTSLIVFGIISKCSNCECSDFKWLYFTFSYNNFRYHSRLTRRLSVTIVSFFPIKQLFFETIDTQWYNNLRRNSIWNTVTFSIIRKLNWLND